MYTRRWKSVLNLAIIDTKWDLTMVKGKIKGSWRQLYVEGEGLHPLRPEWM